MHEEIENEAAMMTVDKASLIIPELLEELVVRYGYEVSMICATEIGSLLGAAAIVRSAKPGQHEEAMSGLIKLFEMRLRETYERLNNDEGRRIVFGDSQKS